LFQRLVEVAAADKRVVAIGAVVAAARYSGSVIAGDVSAAAADAGIVFYGLIVTAAADRGPATGNIVFASANNTVINYDTVAPPATYDSVVREGRGLPDRVAGSGADEREVVVVKNRVR
jgi:hypothetical protein